MNKWLGLVRIVVIAGGIAVLAAGCADIRKVTYPAEFKYIEQSEVRSTMSELGKRIWEMDEILSDPEKAVAQRSRVIDLLAEMQSFADTLDPHGKPTNHLLIDQHMPNFIESVELARLAVEMDPPSFYRAGQVSGNCMSCHKHR